ncbi:MAG: PAS domain S-box protein [Syntrophothermus sp.]
MTPAEQGYFKFTTGIIFTSVSAFLLYLFFGKSKTLTPPETEITADLEPVYKLFAENTEEFLWHMDINSGKLTYVSPAVEKHRGFLPGELINRQASEFLTSKYQMLLKEDLADRIAAFEKGDETQLIRTSEIEEINRDGTPVSAEIKTILIKNKDGKVGSIIGISRNISEVKKAEKLYLESQTQIEAIFNATDDLIWSVDPVNFGVSTYNNGFRDYFLKKRGIEIKSGMIPEDLVPHEYADLWYEMYNTALEKGSYITEYTTVSMSNALLLTMNTLRSNNKVFGISVFGKDIAAQKKLEKMQLANERKYRDIFKIFPHPAMIIQLYSGIYIEINSEFENISGYSRADIIGKSDFALNLWTDPEKRNNLISQLKATGYIKEQPINMRRKDGMAVNCTISASIIEIDGKLLALIVLKEITEIEDVIQLLNYKYIH